MRLYHVPNTRSTRVLWLLEEIGAPYELTVMEPAERKLPEHLQRHPLGRVPVIEEEGGYVFESAGICLHLADLHPEAELIAPVGTHERALAYQWVLFSMTELEAGLLSIFAFRELDEEKTKAATERFRAAAKVVENALEGREWLLGAKFGVADLVCAGVLFYARRFELLDGLPRIAEYLERIDARPARQRATKVGVPASA